MDIFCTWPHKLLSRALINKLDKAGQAAQVLKLKELQRTVL